jgi:hypothetical protein
MAPQGGRFRAAVRQSAAALTILTLGTGLSACSATSRTAGNEPKPAATSRPAIVPTATSNSNSSWSSFGAQSAVEQAINAYTGMWRDFVTAGRTSDWQSPLLGDHATGDALLQMSRGLYADHYNGLVTRGAPVDHPVVKSATPTAEPTTVIISDCGDSTHFLKYYASTGQLAPEGDGGRQAITAEALKAADGTWKIDRFAVEDVGTC